METRRIRKAPSGPFEDLEIPTDTDDLENASEVAGESLTDALNNLNGGGPGAVSSVFGRTGEVVATAGDYNSDEVENVSDVPGATVSAALEALQSATVAALPLSGIRWVDQNTTIPEELRNGTEAAPYASIAALMTYIATQDPGTSWQVKLAGNQIYAENIALPDGFYFLIDGGDGAALSGTFTWTASDEIYLQLRNLYLLQGLSVLEGADSGRCSIVLLNVSADGVISAVDAGMVTTVIVQGYSQPIVKSPWTTYGPITGLTSVIQEIDVNGNLYASQAFIGAARASEMMIQSCCIGIEGGIGGNTLRASGTRVYLENTLIKESKLVFSGSAGELWVDTTSNFWWKAQAQTLTNGSKVIKSDATM